ncbi:MAG: hypothetical protein AB2535_13900 [Candidatus Thiodiazotropha endolucinida]
MAPVGQTPTQRFERVQSDLKVIFPKSLSFIVRYFAAEDASMALSNNARVAGTRLFPYGCCSVPSRRRPTIAAAAEVERARKNKKNWRRESDGAWNSISSLFRINLTAWPGTRSLSRPWAATMLSRI